MSLFFKRGPAPTGLVRCLQRLSTPAQSHPRPSICIRRNPARGLATQTTETVPLAFELLEPSRPSTRGHDSKTAPILFLHGFLGSKKNNRSVSRAIARDLGRHVYIIDLRNHGDSPHHPRHDYMSMADDVKAFIREHGLSQPSIIGHSMGAKTAMTVALDAPDLVSDIIAVDNSPVDAAVQSDFSSYLKGMREIEAAEVDTMSQADKILAPYEESVAIRQFLLGNMHRPEGSRHRKFRIPIDILSKHVNHMGDFPFKDPQQARFKKPALFVRGTKSRYVPDDVLPTIGQFFPRFELVDIEAGHWVTSESPEEFRRAVVEFLSPRE